MKRLWSLALALLLCAVWAAPALAAGEMRPPAVTADAYLVMDAATGQILIEKNAWQRRYPASITKIMTMALAMEHCGGDLSQQVTVSYAAVHTLEYGSSHVALQPDEVVTLRDLFHATVLASANDAANVLAEYTAGSMEAFAALMNEKAAALGMADTHFVNANGLHDDAHYTTARDMAVLTRWAMTVPGFAELFGATEYVMAPTNKQEQQRRWGTDNCMLVTNKYQYDGTLGGKSGWTQEAGYTMVEAVERDGRTLLCVVLGCDKKYDKFSDSIALLDYCFENFAPVTLDAQQLHLPEVPVYYDEAAPSVGAAPLALPPEGCTVLLHTSLQADAVEAAFQTPERYLTEQPFEAVMTLSLPDSAAGCMYPQLAQLSLTVDADAVRALLDANAKVFVDKPAVWGVALRVLGVVLALILALAALVLLRIAYVAWVKARRRKRRRMRRQGAAAVPAMAAGPRGAGSSPARRPKPTGQADAAQTDVPGRGDAVQHAAPPPTAPHIYRAPAPPRERRPASGARHAAKAAPFSGLFRRHPPPRHARRG